MPTYNPYNLSNSSNNLFGGTGLAASMGNSLGNDQGSIASWGGVADWSQPFSGKSNAAAAITDAGNAAAGTGTGAATVTGTGTNATPVTPAPTPSPLPADYSNLTAQELSDLLNPSHNAVPTYSPDALTYMAGGNDRNTMEYLYSRPYLQPGSGGGGYAIPNLSLNPGDNYNGMRVSPYGQLYTP